MNWNLVWSLTEAKTVSTFYTFRLSTLAISLFEECNITHFLKVKHPLVTCLYCSRKIIITMKNLKKKSWKYKVFSNTSMNFTPLWDTFKSLHALLYVLVFKSWKLISINSVYFLKLSQHFSIWYYTVGYKEQTHNIYVLNNRNYFHLQKKFWVAISRKLKL